MLSIAAVTLALLASQVELPRTATPITLQASQIPHWKGTSVEGKSVTLRAGQITVVALTSSSCPLAMKQGPSLARIEESFASKNVRFVFLGNRSDSAGDLRKFAKALRLEGSVTQSDQLGQMLAAHTSTETFLFDAKGVLKYRGAIHDQYGLSSALPAPRNHYLADAIEAVLKGKTPVVQATTSPGCLLSYPKPTPIVAATYHNRISRIVQNHCLECHRKGGVAPFTLEDYKSLKSRSAMIRGVVESGIMPPWFAKDKGASPWKNDRTIPATDKKELLTWLNGPMPEGDSKDAPAPLAYNPNWKIGLPDAVFKMPRPISIKAEGIMAYQNVMVTTDFAEDKWVQRLEVKPSAPQVVHHVLIFVYPPNARSRGFDGLEEISGFFAAYVPGNNTLIYPDGFAKKLPKGSRLKFQIHYTPNGTATEDLTQLGLTFSKTAPKHEVHTVGIVNLALNIPPGAPKHPVNAVLSVPQEAKILSLMPHMHVRGAACRYDLIRNDKRTTLLDIPRYDFNWQLAYDYRSHLDVGPGDKIEFTAWYDNSPQNPNNPDPTKTVRWGLQTADEMHLGYMEYYYPNQVPGEPVRLMRGINFR